MSDEAPVPLAEQIAAVHEHIAYWKRRERWGKEENGKHIRLGKFDDQISMWSAVLTTLQQHERAMAALRDIRLRAQGDGLRTFDKAIDDLMWIDDECRLVLAALDDAASAAATPAGKGEPNVK